MTSNSTQRAPAPAAAFMEQRVFSGASALAPRGPMMRGSRKEKAGGEVMSPSPRRRLCRLQSRLQALAGLGFQVLAGLLVHALHGQLHLAAIHADALHLHRIAFLHHVGDGVDALRRSSLMWTRPSRGPRKFTKAPKSTTFTTLPL